MKNILLVMQSGGYLAPPAEKPEQAELWNETWKKLNRFLPNLYKELYPEEPIALPTRSASVKKEAKGGNGEGSGAKKEDEGSEDGESDVKTSVGTFVKS
jgi:brefeldin A-resistance guanine nucleotide exchange factor 1